ncbi:MAG: PAS-domain containing protein [Tepidimonas ignava]
MLIAFALLGWACAAAAGWAWWHAHDRQRRTQGLLDDERQRFSELLDRLDIAHWRRNLDSGELWWSAVFRRMHGIGPEEAAARENALRHLVPDDRARVNQELEQAYQRGQGETHYRLRQPDGRVTHHLLRITVTRDPASGQRIAYGINIDITERVRLEEALRQRSAYLEAIVHNLPMGLSVFDRDLKLRVWNAEFGRVLELPAELLREGVDFGDLIRVPASRGEYGPVDVEQAVAERRALALRFEPHRLERTRPNGRTHLVIGEPIHVDGELLGFVTTYTDITDEQRQRLRLERTVDVLQTLVANIPVGVSMVDGELKVQVWNELLVELLDLPRALLAREGVTLSDVLRYNVERGEYGPTDDPEGMLRALTERALRFEPHHFERVRPNGRVLEVRGQPLRTGGFVTVYTDITERRRAQAEIERLARTDTLTGLANRTAWLEQLHQALAARARRGGQLAVLFIDLDRFKPVNDSLGHAAGDAVLQQTAQRLRQRLRQSDLIGRLGGDEFVVTLPDLDDDSQAARVAMQLLQALTEPFEVAVGEAAAPQRVYLSPSIGIALAPRDADTAAELLRLADLAMYSAKTDGGASWRYYEPAMNDAVLRRIELETRLRDAIRIGALELHYQPIHALRDGLPLLGFEALVRWPQPDGTLLPPAQFIPLAESSAELIDALGAWVCATALHHLTLWRRDHPGLTLSVNLSARQFDRVGLADRVIGVVAASRGESDDGQAPLQGLEFEITEGAMMRDPQRTHEELTRLREAGATIAIDDFGTGYSSLAYLKQLPIDRLKIDRTFVRDLDRDADDAAIVLAAVELAHRLGRAAVAEGVERPTQLHALRAMGCDAVQGYGLAQPMPARQVPAYLRGVAAGEHLRWLQPTGSPSAAA